MTRSEIETMAEAVTFHRAVSICVVHNVLPEICMRQNVSLHRCCSGVLKHSRKGEKD